MQACLKIMKVHKWKPRDRGNAAHWDQEWTIENGVKRWALPADKGVAG